jgi:hypothetical protein
MKKIIFTDIVHPDGVLEKPKPASQYVPKWYKDAKPYTDPSGKKAPTMDNTPAATIKRCMPVWDLMTAGYIIETPYDIYIRQTPTGPYFQWGSFESIAFQTHEQFQNHPYSRDINYAVRILHPWSIKTPKGWSVLICEPQHQEPTPIITANGIVDTDKYSLPFNMFIKLRDPNFEGMIPAGTPFAQIIPFKRESWVSKLGGDDERKRYHFDLARFQTIFFDRYKKFWWSKKEYK